MERSMDDPRAPRVHSATPEERDEQLRRLWRRERDDAERERADEPQPQDRPDFSWWGPW